MNRITIPLGIAIIAIFVVLGFKQVTQGTHMLFLNGSSAPKDCLTLPDINGGNYLKPNPLSLPFCGFAKDHFVGQKALTRADFRIPCPKGQVAVDIYMGGYGNPMARCSSNRSEISAYRAKFRDILSGSANPNTAKPELTVRFVPEFITIGLNQSYTCRRVHSGIS
jgi:hypothetical protein